MYNDEKELTKKDLLKKEQDQETRRTRKILNMVRRGVSIEDYLEDTGGELDEVQS